VCGGGRAAEERSLPLSTATTTQLSDASYAHVHFIIYLFCSVCDSNQQELATSRGNGFFLPDSNSTGMS